MASTNAPSNITAPPVDTPAAQDATSTDAHDHYTETFLDRHALRFDWTEPPTSGFEARIRGIVATRMRLRERQRQEALVTAERKKNGQNGNTPVPHQRHDFQHFNADDGSQGRIDTADANQQPKGRIPVILVFIHTTDFVKYTPLAIRTLERNLPLVKYRKISLETVHDPLRGIEALSYKEARALLCSQYLREFGRLHGKHGHDASGKNGLMLQMSVKFDQEAQEEMIDAENWWWTLNAMYIATPKVKIEGAIASCCWLVVRAGCEGGSRKRKTEDEAECEKAKKQRKE